MGEILRGPHAIFLPEVKLFRNSYRIQYFNLKPAILAGKLRQFEEAIFLDNPLAREYFSNCIVVIPSVTR